MIPKGRRRPSEVLTGSESGSCQEHLELYQQDAELYRAIVMYLAKKNAPIRKNLLPKATALSLAERDEVLFNALSPFVSALDMKDAVEFMKSKAFGVSLTSKRQEFVKQWARGIHPDKLQWWLLGAGDVMAKIADVAHLHPKDWAGEKWICNVAYGIEEAPEDSKIAAGRKLRKAIRKTKDVNAQIGVLEKVRDIPWHYIRTSYGGVENIPQEVKPILLEKFSVRGIVQNIEMFLDYETELVQALTSKEAGHLPFSVVFDVYVKMAVKSPAIRLALLNLANRQFEKLYMNEDLAPLVIGLDVSPSMETAIGIAATAATMFASKLPKNEVKMFTFGPEIRELKKVPSTLEEALEAMKVLRPYGAGTNIEDFFRLPDVKKAKTVIIVSDGQENAGSTADALTGLNPELKLIYLCVYPGGRYGWMGDVKEYEANYIKYDGLWRAFKDTEIRWQRTVLKNISQLDAIIPLLSYDDIIGREDDLRAMHDMLMGIELPVTRCAACEEETTQFVNIGCQHKFHGKCLKLYWDLLDTGTKYCPYGCRPVQSCAKCGGPIGHNDVDCGHCGYTVDVRVAAI